MRGLAASGAARARPFPKPLPSTETAPLPNNPPTQGGRRAARRGSVRSLCCARGAGPTPLPPYVGGVGKPPHPGGVGGVLRARCPPLNLPPGWGETFRRARTSSFRKAPLCRRGAARRCWVCLVLDAPCRPPVCYAELAPPRTDPCKSRRRAPFLPFRHSCLRRNDGINERARDETLAKVCASGAVSEGRFSGGTGGPLPQEQPLVAPQL